MHSEPVAPVRPENLAGNKNEIEPRMTVVFDEARDVPTISRGQSAEKLPRTTLCLDTGTPLPPPENMRHPETQEEIDAVYRETIRNGVIDHHSIDATVDIPTEKRRCTTAMLADFPEDILAMMKERGTDRVTSHFDSDLDSLCATYLAKSLLQHGRLPSLAKKISEHVNKVDYGGFDEKDPEKFTKSLLGINSSLENVLFAHRDAELDAIWKNPNATREEKIKLSGLVKTRYQNQILKYLFDFLNAAETRNQSEPGSVDLLDLDPEKLGLEPELKEILAEGRLRVKEDFVKFESVFEKAEKTRMTVKDKMGNDRDVELIVIDLTGQTDLHPLAVTYMAYVRVPPDSIIAAYAGPDRKKGGDQYDIGMKPESTEIFDLKFLEKPMNEAEAKMRGPIIAKLEAEEADGTISEENKLKLAKWKMLRPGFESTGLGDPTVSVAGNSLIAASTTSLLDFKGFRSALEKARQGQSQAQG